MLLVVVDLLMFLSLFPSLLLMDMELSKGKLGLGTLRLVNMHLYRI